MTIKGLPIREWIEKVAPALLMGLIIWGIGLYAWQREVTRRMDEVERQVNRQWESLDRVKADSDLKTIKEWIRIYEPIIEKGAGL